MQNKKFFKIIIFIVVLCIPIIYSFFYLKSYWDPYGNLTDLKIALVNLDSGIDGTNRGAELVKELQNKDVMNFCEVSKDDAQKGIENEEYYAVITIPDDFTECIQSAGEENKKVATITYAPNQKNNYLASQIINKVVTATEMSLESKVGTEVVSTLSDTLSDVPESLQKISDGADEIYNGTSELNNGLKELNSGIGLLSNKYTEFDNGVKSAYQGGSNLNNGVSQVNSGINSLSEGATTLDNAIEQINTGVDSISTNGGEKIGVLTNGIETLNNGANSLSEGVNSYVEGANTLANGVQSYVAGVNAIDEKQNAVLQSIITYSNAINSEEVTDETVKALADNAQAILNAEKASGITEKGTALSNGAKNLTESSEALKAGAKSVSDGTKALKEGTSEISSMMEKIGTLKTALTQVKTGTESLESGVSALKAGGTQVEKGTESLEKGLETLSSSSKTVQESLNKLDEGSNSAVSGSEQLLEGVNTFKTEINKGLDEANAEITKLDGLSDFVSDPVVIEEEDYGEVYSYGIAFTPLFLSIGLWVGCLMCYVVLYYDQKHRFGILDNSAKNKILQNLIYIGIGAVTGILTGIVLKLGLGYEVVNLGVYYLECAVVGGVFMTIIQFLIRNFGDIGKFLALIILVLQLAASGGTFPVETIDNGFRFLNPLLPMTYTIKIFKDCLIETSASFIGRNTLIILGIAIVLGIITLGVELVKREKNKKDKNKEVNC